MKEDRLYNESILLIGASGAGKSTVAEELHNITGMPRVSLDRVANQDRRSGFIRNFKNVENYNIYMIKAVIQKAKEQSMPEIVDFGAGHSVYDDQNVFSEVKRELHSFKNIVLLIPSVDIEESIRIMEDRSTGDTRDNRKFLTSQCNRELTTITIYANNRTPNEIANEIIERIRNRDNKREEMEI